MEFSDITLLECNRQQSIQVKSGNTKDPALFTCKLGRGIKLNAGDTVEILNGFISEDGCGGQNMEFNGQELQTLNGFGDDRKISNVVENTYEYTKSNITHNKDEVSELLHIAAEEIKDGNGDYKNSSKTIVMKDNETYVPQRYYKTNNGEGAMFCPRIFSMTQKPVNYFAKQGAAPDNPQQKYPMITFFETIDNVSYGVSPAQYGIPTGDPKDDVFKIAPCDYFLYNSGGSQQFWGIVNTPPPLDQWYKARSDGKRFTMFQAAQSYGLYSVAPDVPYVYNPSVAADKLNYLSNQVVGSEWIAATNYVEHIELKKYSVDAGFYSPENVGAQITEQMQQNVDYITSEGNSIIQPERLQLNDVFNSGGGEKYTIFSTTTTNSYKPIESGGFGHNNEEVYDGLLTARAKIIANPSGHTLTPLEKSSIISYNNSYKYLFVKRPQLFTLGRKLNTFNGIITTNSIPNTKSYIANSIDNSDTSNTPLVTSWEWNTPNLEMLRDLFKAQSQYIDELELGNDRFLHTMTMPDDPTLAKGISAFGCDGYLAPRTSTKGGHTTSSTSAPIRIGYDKTMADTYTDGMRGTGKGNMCYGFATKKLLSNVSNGTQIHFIDVIVIHPELATNGSTNGWVADLFYGHKKDPNDDDKFRIQGVDDMTNGVISEDKGTYIGWDHHALAFSTVCMTAMNGTSYGPSWSSLDNRLKADGTPVATSTTTVNDVSDYAVINREGKNAADSEYHTQQRITQHLGWRYIGANNPSLSYNSFTNSFGFQSLHTAENVNQPDTAGRTTTTFVKGTGGEAPVPDSFVPETTPIVNAAGTECYKINKRLRYNDYTPDMKPYWADFPVNLVYDAGDPSTKDPAHTGVQTPATMSTIERGGIVDLRVDAAETEVAIANQNIEEGAVMDAHCGIFLDIGATCPKTYWNKSFWGLLGFTYEQFHPEELNTNTNDQIRVGENNMFSMKYATTNCQVVSTDLKDYPIQYWGGINYSTQIAKPLIVQYLSGFEKANFDLPPKQDFSYALKYSPFIVQNTQSITTRAQTIPKLMTRPYYTIRSDILDNTKFVGGSHGGIKMSVLSIVNKINGEGDYYFTDGGGMSFTITNPITLTDITTAICDPNGQLSAVNDNSAVIYKISKQMNTSKFDIVKQILEQEVADKKK